MERKPSPPTPDRYRDRDPSNWRWLAAALALAVHAAAWMLLRTSPDLEPGAATAEPDRIRLVWSQREPAPVPPADGPARTSQATPVRDVVAIPATVRAHAPAPAPDIAPAAPAPLTFADDAWTIAPARPGLPGQQTDFRRRLLDDGQADAFAPRQHLPGLRVRDTSLGGRLATMARMMDCGELAAALGRGGGALVGGGHDPGRARPQGGDASSAAVLATMRRRGCR